MGAQAAVRLVHYFDTQSHRIICGLPGFEHRSTKHARGVTCPGCVGLLAERAAEETSTGAAPAGPAAAGGDGRS